MTSKGDRNVAILENAQGGKGMMKKEVLLTPEQMGTHCGLFGEVTILPGSSLGYHEHHGETETYYITSGNGLYNDNGIKVHVKTGDVVFCEDGNGHGMENNGTQELTFVALILKTC